MRTASITLGAFEINALAAFPVQLVGKAPQGSAHIPILAFVKFTPGTQMYESGADVLLAYGPLPTTARTTLLTALTLGNDRIEEKILELDSLKSVPFYNEELDHKQLLITTEGPEYEWGNGILVVSLFFDTVRV